jgi:hypothetical protein
LRFGHVVGALQQPHVGLRVARLVLRDQRLEDLAHGGALPGRVEAGQPGAHPAAGRRGAHEAGDGAGHAARSVGEVLGVLAQDLLGRAASRLAGPVRGPALGRCAGGDGELQHHAARLRRLRRGVLAGVLRFILHVVDRTLKGGCDVAGHRPLLIADNDPSCKLTRPHRHFPSAKEAG